MSGSIDLAAALRSMDIILGHRVQGRRGCHDEVIFQGTVCGSSGMGGVRRCSDLRPPPCKDVTRGGPLAGTLRAGWRGGARTLILANTQVSRDHLLPRVFLELPLESFIPDRFYLLFISRLILPFHMILPLRYPLSHSIMVVNCSGVLAFPLLHYSLFLLLPPFCFSGFFWV